MAFSKEEFTESFIAETNENLENIDNLLIAYRANPKDSSLLSSILRSIHTIKGTARMLGFGCIENLAHGIEDVFKGIQEKRYELTDLIVKLNFQLSDCITRCLSKIKEEGNDQIDTSVFLEACKAISEGLFFNMEKLENANKGITEKSADSSGEENSSLSNISSIRIDIKKINSLIESIDNLIIRQFKFKNELSTLKESLPKQIREDLQLSEEAIINLQKEILDLRMLPLSIILNPLKKEIETDAINLGKKIFFTVPEDSFMLDKTVLEQLKEILLHIVRNSLDHGIETEEERKAAGKNPVGKISIIAERFSSSMNITVSDDGKGLQFDKIRQKAIENDPLHKDEIEKLSENELEQFIFQSGFTTKTEASHLSGRGIGMDVVRTNLEHIKGRIKIKSEKGKGCTTELSIPLTLATQQGLFINVNRKHFMIPSHYIKKILNFQNADLTNLQGLSYLKLSGQFVPFYHLSTIIDSSASERSSDSSSIIVLEYLDSLVAVCVSSISDYQNIIVYPLPELLKDISALQGVVYDDEYRIVPILNVPFIMQKLKTLVAYDLKKHEVQNQRKVYTILIVDDSSTTRQIEQTIFESDGYSVLTAQDGIEALDILNSNHVDAIITDINMPRMDGSALLQNLQRIQEFSSIPVVIVSAIYDKDQENLFLSQGAKKFIVKSDFQRGNLLNSVKELLNGRS